LQKYGLKTADTKGLKIFCKFENGLPEFSTRNKDYHLFVTPNELSFNERE